MTLTQAKQKYLTEKAKYENSEDRDIESYVNAKMELVDVFLDVAPALFREDTVSLLRSKRTVDTDKVLGLALLWADI